MSWRDWAACFGMPQEFWFPETTTTKPLEWGPARAICGVCIVKQECLDEAIRNEERFGMWGGTTPAERGLAAQPLQHRPVVKFWTIKCDRCGVPFEVNRKDRKFCDEVCAEEARADRKRERKRELAARSAGLR